MSDVEADMIQTVNLHLLIDSTGHNVTGSQRQTLIVFLHELFAIRQFQNTAIATHGLGDEVGRVGLLRIVEHSGVELHELHVGNGAFGTIHHSDAVACCNDGIGGREIYGTTATCTHHRDFRKIGIYLLRLGIQHIGAIALDVGRAACNANAQMVLGDNLYSKMILFDVDVGIVSHGFHQSALDLGTRIVGMMEDAELGVTALAVQVEGAIFRLVEVHPPFHQFLDLSGGVAYHLLHRLAVGDVVSSDDSVGNVLVEGI